MWLSLLCGIDNFSFSVITSQCLFSNSLLYLFQLFLSFRFGEIILRSLHLLGEHSIALGCMLCRMIHFVNIFSSLSPIASPKGAEETLCFNQFSVIKNCGSYVFYHCGYFGAEKGGVGESKMNIRCLCVFVISVVVIVFSVLL